MFCGDLPALRKMLVIEESGTTQEKNGNNLRLRFVTCNIKDDFCIYMGVNTLLTMKPNKKPKTLRITEKDFLLANRRAARMEEIEAHGKPVSFRKAIHKSKKVYDRKALKRKAHLEES